MAAPNLLTYAAGRSRRVRAAATKWVPPRRANGRRRGTRRSELGLRGHRNPRRGCAPVERSSRVLRRRHPATVCVALACGHRVVIGTGGTRVTDGDDQQEIAHAAWRIVAATGGLVDRAEIARRYNLSRGRVHQLTGQKHFPRPVHGAGTSHPLWLAVDVEAYRAQPPPVGRPPKESAGTSS